MAVRFTGPMLHDGRNSNRGQFDQCPISIEPDYFTVWDDFTGINLDSGTGFKWTTTVDAGGSSVAVLADTAGGVCRIASQATTDNVGGALQGDEVFSPAAGKDIWFFTRVRVSDATQTELAVGLAIDLASNPEDLITTADHILFTKADGVATVNCVSDNATTVTTHGTAVHTMEDDTWVEFAFHLTSNTKLEFYVNKALVATGTTDIPNTQIALSAYMISGDDQGTKTFDIDYLGATQIR